MAVRTPDSVWEDVCPPLLRRLADEHRRVLEEESGILPEIIESRGYHSLTQAQIVELTNLGVLSEYAMKASGWMAIPIYRPDGVKHGEVIRLFGYSGSFKYLWPSKSRLTMDVHPDLHDLLKDPSVDIIITEGIKKADAILSAARREGYPCVTIALNGCYGWRMAVGDTSMALTDFSDIVWSGRKVYIVSDSDYRTNDEVSRGWNECAQYISGKTGEHRTFLVVPPQEGREKIGADDYLAAGFTLDQLLGHAQSPKYALRSLAGQARGPLRIKSGLQLMDEAGEKIPHLIEPLLPEQSIFLLAGHTGTFKTWTAANLAMDGAYGHGWLDHPGLTMSEPFATLYVNKEMSGIILGSRLKLLARDNRYKKMPDWRSVIEKRVIFADEAALDLNLPEQRARLEDAIVATGAKLVVLDSLSMCWHGDENSSTEVGAFYSALRDITERTHVAWLLIHHLLKPQAGRQKENPIFSVRGSGQLMQQADAAVLLSHYSGENTTAEPSEEKLLVATHVKARTDVEMKAWIIRFSTNDGIYASIRYLCTLADAKAHAFAKSSGDPDRLKEWLLAEFIGMPAMLSTSSGMRYKTLVTLLQQNWTVAGKEPPSDSTIRRQLQVMVDAGEVVVLERNKRHGDLYRMADSPEPVVPETPETSEEPEEVPT